MKQYIKKLRRYIRISIYQFTKKKHQLDEYMKLMRRGYTLSEYEVATLKELIDNENKVYER